MTSARCRCSLQKMSVNCRVIEEGREAQEKLDAGKRSADLKAKVAKAAHAKDRFIRSNLRLVVSIARRYPLPQGTWTSSISFKKETSSRDMRSFDWRRGFKFSTYATFWIRQAIGRALDQKASLIRIPGDRQACVLRSDRLPATAKISIRQMPNCTASPPRSALTRRSVTMATQPSVT